MAQISGPRVASVPANAATIQVTIDKLVFLAGGNQSQDRRQKYQKHTTRGCGLLALSGLRRASSNPCSRNIPTIRAIVGQGHPEWRISRRNRTARPRQIHFILNNWDWSCSTSPCVTSVEIRKSNMAARSTRRGKRAHEARNGGPRFIFSLEALDEDNGRVGQETCPEVSTVGGLTVKRKERPMPADFSKSG